jgi:hypothetical protein
MEKPAETLLLTCAPIAAGLLFFFGALYFWRSGREIREHGVTGQATIVKKLRKGGGLENYYAVIAFTDLQGRPQSVEINVHSRSWHGLHEGGSEGITYLPGRPETAEMTPLWAKHLFGGVFLFFAAVGGLMAVIGLVLLVRLLAGWLRT